jgi:hypothetical protein
MGGSDRGNVLNGGWLYQPLAQGKGVEKFVDAFRQFGWTRIPEGRTVKIKIFYY